VVTTTSNNSPNHLKEENELVAVIEQLAANTKAFMDETKMNFKNQAKSIDNLEVQVGQIAKLLSVRMQGSLLNNTVKNLKDQVHTITLRSGKQLEPTHKPSVEYQKDIRKKEEKH